MNRRVFFDARATLAGWRLAAAAGQPIDPEGVRRLLAAARQAAPSPGDALVAWFDLLADLEAEIADGEHVGPQQFDAAYAALDEAVPMTREEMIEGADAHRKWVDTLPEPKRKRTDAPMDGVVVEPPKKP